MNLMMWAASIGYVPVTGTDEELVEYIRGLSNQGNQSNHLHWLTEFAAVNEETGILDWLEEYHLLDHCIVVKAAAAGGNITMMEYCRDHGYDISDCCWIACLHNHKELLNWLRANGCNCGTNCQYHKK